MDPDQWLECFFRNHRNFIYPKNFGRSIFYQTEKWNLKGKKYLEKMLDSF